MTLYMMTGCEYSFELDNVVEDPLMCIRSYMSVGDSSVIRLNKTVPVTVIRKLDTAIVSPSYSLRCNVNIINPTSVCSENGSLIIRTGGFRSGDRLEITAGAEGTGTASASTVVPEEFPDYSIELFKDEKGEYWVRILINEMPEKGNFYGAAIDYYADMESEEEGKESRREEGHAQIEFNDESLPLDYKGFYPYYINRDDRDIVLWSEEDIADGAYEIRVNLYINPNGYRRIERHIKVHLLRFSEEMYRTLYAEAATDNFLASLGFSSPSFTYNSINNGVGYFGAYSYTCSDWVTETISGQ